MNREYTVKGESMDNTKVDDMLIEMITPKVNEIQEKFSSGGALTQDDINTLLLKSQYNHINHLDSKLNEVVADVASLKGDFNQFKTEIRGEFDQFKTEITGKFETLTVNVEKLIAKSVNKNMAMLVVIMSFFLTLSKLIDKF